MDAVEFILIIAVFAVVLVWYLRNAEAGSEALLGLLALSDDPAAAKGEKRRSYRIKPRVARKKAELHDSRVEPDAAPSYRVRGDEERLRFRRQDEARYKVKDKAAGFKPRAPRR